MSVVSVLLLRRREQDERNERGLGNRGLLKGEERIIGRAEGKYKKLRKKP